MDPPSVAVDVDGHAAAPCTQAQLRILVVDEVPVIPPSDVVEHCPWDDQCSANHPRNRKEFAHSRESQVPTCPEPFPECPVEEFPVEIGKAAAILLQSAIGIKKLRRNNGLSSQSDRRQARYVTAAPRDVRVSKDQAGRGCASRADVVGRREAQVPGGLYDCGTQAAGDLNTLVPRPVVDDDPLVTAGIDDRGKTSERVRTVVRDRDYSRSGCGSVTRPCLRLATGLGCAPFFRLHGHYEAPVLATTTRTVRARMMKSPKRLQFST